MSKNVGELNVKLTADTKPLEQGINTAVDKVEEANNSVEKLDSSSLNTLKNTINNVFSTIKNIGNSLKSSLSQAQAPVENLNSQIEAVKSHLKEANMNTFDLESTLQNLSVEQIQQQMDSYKSTSEQAKAVLQQLQAQLQLLDDTDVNSDKITELKDNIQSVGFVANIATTRIRQLQEYIDSIQPSPINEVSDNIKELGNNVKNTSKSIDKLGVRVANSMKNGLSSVKRFALGLLGIRTVIGQLTSAMRTYINSSDKLKASTTGASQALAQALAPYCEIAVAALRKLVNWVITAIAYITTFINALFGTKIAINTASKNMKNLTKNTKAAGKAAKSALAPFDELNILQTDSGGGGTSAVAPDFSGMGMNDDQMSKLDEFKKKMEDFANSPLWQAITDNWKDIIGLILLIGTLIGIVTGGWLVAIVAFVGFVLLYAQQIWDFIVLAANAVWEVIKSIGIAILAIILSVVASVGAVIKTAYELIKSIILLIWDTIKTVFTTITDTIKLAIDTVINIFKTLWDIIKTIFSSIWNTVKIIFSGIKDFIVKIIRGDIIGAFKSLLSTITIIFKSIWNTIKSIFSKIWDFISSVAKGIGDVFKNSIRGVVNAIISFAENTINGFLKAINLAISVINAIPGVNIKKLTLLKIPRLAGGGVAKGPSVVEIGEYSGAKSNPEIVSPRDMMYDTIVKALRENKDTNITQQSTEMTIYVKYEDGRTIIRKINNAQNEAGRTLLEV